MQVYLGEQYVNNSTLSDVTFLVEGSNSVMIQISFFFVSCCVFTVSAVLHQANGFMPTEFVYLLRLMHFEQCLMVVTG